MDDEVAAVTNEQQSADQNINYEVKSALKNVEVPMKGGSPAFSIHADKVYILYPSLFQDPNIFGRFSIPQTINLDPLPDKTLVKNADTNQDTTTFQRDTSSNGFNPYHQQGRKMYRRQAPDQEASDQQASNQEAPNQKAPNPAPAMKKSSSRKEEKKRNVESHLTGTIVVLNQDVNEFNRKETYWMHDRHKFRWMCWITSNWK